MSDSGGIDGEALANLASGIWNRAKPGDGRALRPFRPSLLLTRTRYELATASAHYTVDVDHGEGEAWLYRDGVQIAKGEMSVRFPVEEGVIEAAASLYGMRRVQLLARDGAVHPFAPAAGTPEDRRARFGRRHPRASRLIGAAAVGVLVIDLVLLAPQLLEVVTHLDLYPEEVPAFVSPIVLPVWANTTLAVAGVLAGVERALTFRRHRLLDADSELFGD